jgi:hypothetical protein
MPQKVEHMRTQLRVAQLLLESSSQQGASLNSAMLDDLAGHFTTMSVKGNVIHIDLSENNCSVHAVGFLAYLVGDGEGRGMEMNAFMVDGRKIFEFAFRNLDESKRMFVRACLYDGTKPTELENLKFQIAAPE